MTATRYLYLARHAEADPTHGALTETGRDQARALGRRLHRVRPHALFHGPLPRARQTAQLVAEHLGLTPEQVPEADDHPPHVPTRAELPPALADGVLSFLGNIPPRTQHQGAHQAQAALERFTGPVEGHHERREVVITHAHLVGWLLGQALNAPAWRWVSIAPANASLTVLRYTPGAPASVMVFNDQAHLVEEDRWTGFPDHLRT